MKLTKQENANQMPKPTNKNPNIGPSFMTKKIAKISRSNRKLLMFISPMKEYGALCGG